jgi:hypothetical protein
MSRRAALVITLLAANPLTALAQGTAGSAREPAPPAQVRGAQPPDTAPPVAGGLRPLRVAKWTTLIAAAASGIYGFVENARADDRFAELEQQCQARRAECRRRTADGAYEDAALEELYQRVRRHDRRAHRALLSGQIGVAASVGLFLLDLGNVRPPSDVPWVPGTVRLERGPGTVQLSLKLPLGTRRE